MYKFKHLIISLSIALFYLTIWRPIRTFLAQDIFLPLFSYLNESVSSGWIINSSQKSVSILLTKPDELNGLNEIAFGTPWGFYLFVPLVLLVAFKKSKELIQLHIALQIGLGVFSILFFVSGIYWADFLFHFNRFVVSYLTPGFTFILLFLAFFKDGMYKLIAKNQ